MPKLNKTGRMWNLELNYYSLQKLQHLLLLFSGRFICINWRKGTCSNEAINRQRLNILLKSRNRQKLICSSYGMVTSWSWIQNWLWQNQRKCWIKWKRLWRMVIRRIRLPQCRILWKSIKFIKPKSIRL